MKTLSIVPLISIGSLFTFLVVFSPIANVFHPVGKTVITTEMKKKKFDNFLANFEAINLPYAIGQSDFSNYMEQILSNDNSKSRKIDSEFKAFVPGLGAKFSRMGPSTYIYEGIIEQTENYAAVLYSEHAPYRDYPEYQLVTYSSNGEIISNTTFAHRTYDQLIIGNIDSKKQITIKTYTFDSADEGIQYEKSIEDSKLHLQNVAALKINKKGDVEDTSTAAMMEIKEGEGK